MNNEADRYTYLNLKLDAFSVISEAVTEYMMLQRSETPNIVRFKAYLISTRENGL